MAKELLFSITENDFEIQTFRSGGKGGQHQNKTESGVRLIHKASGARGEARDSRSQYTNKKEAFHRLINSPTFKAWHKLEVARHLGNPVVDIEKEVDKAMAPENILVEVRDEDKWVKECI